MREDAPFDVEGPLLWGYFFVDADKARLKPLAEELARQGFREAGLFRSDDRGTYFLQVERVERHTPESLHQLNQQLYALAERFGIASYDGMDAGPVEPDAGDSAPQG
jgi:hypothetical protein